MTPTFRLPTRTIIEPGSLAHLAREAKALRCRRPLLVFDSGLSETPWPDKVSRELESIYDRVEKFDSIEPNPRAHTIDRAAEVAREFDADLVVAIGGGSVLDAAKAVSMLIRNDGGCIDYEGKTPLSLCRAGRSGS